MGYNIKETNSKFEVTEEGYEWIILGRCDSLEDAEILVRTWKARDDLQDRIQDFMNEMIDDFGTILPATEIREMIKS